MSMKSGSERAVEYSGQKTRAVAVPGDQVMDDLGIPTTGSPVVAFAPPSVLRRQSAAWEAVEVENVEVLRHEPFEYKSTATRHLLIASERVNRDDGETHVDGLPRSHLRTWNRKLTFIPAGHRFDGWQKPRALSRGTHLYIDPRSPLLQPALRFDETR